MVKRAPWLSLTPEPERELPEAVATLVLGRAEAPAVARERLRIERLILRGSQRSWLAYLHSVLDVIESRAGEADAQLVAARTRATEVIANHHNLLLGLPGRGAQMSAPDRRRLERLAEPASRPEHRQGDR